MASKIAALGSWKDPKPLDPSPPSVACGAVEGGESPVDAISGWGATKWLWAVGETETCAMRLGTAMVGFVPVLEATTEAITDTTRTVVMTVYFLIPTLNVRWVRNVL